MYLFLYCISYIPCIIILFNCQLNKTILFSIYLMYKHFLQNMAPLIRTLSYFFIRYQERHGKKVCHSYFYNKAFEKAARQILPLDIEITLPFLLNEPRRAINQIIVYFNRPFISSCYIRCIMHEITTCLFLFLLSLIRSKVIIVVLLFL